MTSGDSSYTWTYSGDQLFDGLKLSDGTLIPVGGSGSLSASSGASKTSSLTVVTSAAPEPDPQFVYTVNTDEFTITYSSTEESVNVELWVGPNGYICYFSDDRHGGCYFDYELDDDQVFWVCQKMPHLKTLIIHPMRMSLI